MTTLQEIHHMAEVWVPIDPYTERGTLNGLQVLPPSAQEIASDIAFNKREENRRVTEQVCLETAEVGIPHVSPNTTMSQ
jgi:hypothetical protein